MTPLIDPAIIDEPMETGAVSMSNAWTRFLNMEEGPADVLMVIIAGVFAVGLWRIS